VLSLDFQARKPRRQPLAVIRTPQIHAVLCNTVGARYDNFMPDPSEREKAGNGFWRGRGCSDSPQWILNGFPPWRASRLRWARNATGNRQTNVPVVFYSYKR
jgi:hypothetical protein